MKKLFVFSALLMVAAVIVNFESGFAYGKYLFCAGGLGYIVCRVMSAYKGDDFRLKRLNRLYGFCGILAILAGYLIFTGNNAYIVVLLLLSLLELFLSYRSDYYHNHPLK